MTVDETLRNQADYLDALAAAIRTVNGRLDALTRTDLEARLGVGGALNDSLGAAPRTQFGQSAPAATLGNTQPFIGQTNVLPDPTWQGLVNGISSTVGGARLSSKWTAKHVLNSGVLPTQHDVAGGYYYRGSNPFNSDQIEISFLGFGANACDMDLYLYPASPFDPAGTTQMALPYLAAAVRYSHQAPVGGDATVSITLEIVRDTGIPSGEVVVAASMPLNPATLAISDVRQMLATTAQTAGDFNLYTWRWRLRVHVVKPASVTSGISLTFGEPQLHFAYTPDALAYAPIIAGWDPKEVVSEGSTPTALVVSTRISTELTPRFEVSRVGNIDWYDGASAFSELRLRRSGTREMSIDDGLTGPVQFKVVGPAFAQGPDSMDLAITYGAFGPTLVTRTDGALISTTTITYTGAGLIATVVTTRFAKTFTVTPVYTGANITSVHRAVA